MDTKGLYRCLPDTNVLQQIYLYHADFLFCLYFVKFLPHRKTFQIKVVAVNKVYILCPIQICVRWADF
jgi:hypothetical protein